MGCCSSTIKDGEYVRPHKASKIYAAFEETVPDLKGKTIAITGCTSDGIGFCCARACARKGATVLMLNRESPRAADAERRIRADVPNANVKTIICDLTSFESVRAAASQIRAELSVGLDVLCCNAAVMAFRDVATADGYDVQMQTNHLSHFLLAKELFPLLEHAATLRGEARIVATTSSARWGTKGLEEEYLGANGGSLGGDSASVSGGARWTRYSQSKLANSLFIQALHERLAAREGSGSRVKAVCCCPGGCVTDLQVNTDKDGGLGRWKYLFTHHSYLLQSAEDGSLSVITACAMAGVRSGELLEPSKGGHMRGPVGRTKLTRAEKDAGAKSMLWASSEQACGPWPL